MTCTPIARLLRCLLFLFGAAGSASAGQPAAAERLKVFLDCTGCYQDFLRTEATFVNYVRDRSEADVHVLITRAETGSGGLEYTLAFIATPGPGTADQTLKTVTTSSDPEDVVRRQLATALRVGLLRYIVRDGVPGTLAVTVGIGSQGTSRAAARDRWNKWVFSLQGTAAFDGEESSRERSLGVEVGADRITPNWKVSLGVEVDHQREEFDLDEEEPVEVERRERDFQWLLVKALGEHWSVGAEGDVESSTFDNTRLAFGAAPAIEYNLFPYSMYTRRQLRALYAVGVQRVEYYEQTLFGKTEETLPQHEVSLAFEQRERWGSLEARTQWSQYLHDLSRTRLQAEGQVSVRVAKGLSLGAELDASRIRDQLFLPARGATAEEIFLRLRRLQSGYEYRFAMNVTYTFGSIFSSIVNPRFGQ
jgi:hypothetical protein